MSMTVNVAEAKARLSDLLRQVEAGEDIVIARAGRPIATLRPVRQPDFVFGRYAQLASADVDSFLDPMPEDELADWEGSQVAPPA